MQVELDFSAYEHISTLGVKLKLCHLDIYLEFIGELCKIEIVRHST